MAKLDPGQTLALARLFVRSQNLLKGKAIDEARLALPSDRQFEQFKKTMKDHESGLRRVFMNALVTAGLIEAPVSIEDLSRMK